MRYGAEIPQTLSRYASRPPVVARCSHGWSCTAWVNGERVRSTLSTREAAEQRAAEWLENPPCELLLRQKAGPDKELGRYVIRDNWDEYYAGNGRWVAELDDALSWCSLDRLPAEIDGWPRGAIKRNRVHYTSVYGKARTVFAWSVRV